MRSLIPVLLAATTLLPRDVPATTLHSEPEWECHPVGMHGFDPDGTKSCEFVRPIGPSFLTPQAVIFHWQTPVTNYFDAFDVAHPLTWEDSILWPLQDSIVHLASFALESIHGRTQPPLHLDLSLVEDAGLWHVRVELMDTQDGTILGTHSSPPLHLHDGDPGASPANSFEPLLSVSLHFHLQPDPFGGPPRTRIDSELSIPTQNSESQAQFDLGSPYQLTTRALGQLGESHAPDGFVRVRVMNPNP